MAFSFKSLVVGWFCVSLKKSHHCLNLNSALHQTIKEKVVHLFYPEAAPFSHICTLIYVPSKVHFRYKREQEKNALLVQIYQSYNTAGLLFTHGQRVIYTTHPTSNISSLRAILRTSTFTAMLADSIVRKKL